MCPADVSDVKPRAPGRPREAATEDAILDAALGLLNEQCYSEITIEKIASRAGVGKPTIYRRWKAKSDLMLTAYATRVIQRASPILPSGDVFIDLEHFLERMFLATNHPTNERALRCFIAESQYDPEFRRGFYALFLATRRSAMKELLAFGQINGQIRADLNLEVACDLLYGAFAARLINGVLPRDPGFARDIVGMLRPGLAPDKSVGA